MSTNYRLSKKIRINELLDGRLESFGVRQMNDETSAKQKCLTDGNNFLWVYIDDEGYRHNVDAILTERRSRQNSCGRV